MAADRTYLRVMGELLVFHKIIAKPKDLTADNLEDRIMEFQAAADLLIDGDPGPETLWRLQEPHAASQPKLAFAQCKADVVSGVNGYDSLALRADVAKRFRALRSEANKAGGVVTTAGGRRALSSGASAGRSAKSMHYTGLAFDLATTSGFFKPASDPYVVTRLANGRWEVWARAEKGSRKELTAVFWDGWNSGVDRKRKVTGKFINFTKLCLKHGFSSIGPRRSFTRATDRNYLGAEWWHFQANAMLIPNLSQFGIELLKIEGYAPDHIRSVNDNIWSNRKAIFKRHWS